MRMNVKERRCLKYFFETIRFAILSFASLLFFLTSATAQDKYLKQSLSSITESNNEVSGKTAHYKPMFGEKDNIVKAIKRFAVLTIDPNGESKAAEYRREELICYVLKGTGMLHYEEKNVPISKDDFFYVPVNTKYSFSNPRSDTLIIVVMGFKIPDSIEIKQTPGLKLASANDVRFQPLSQHGETSKYKLLLGSTRSRRDKIAAAYQVTSLFIIDFDPAGTNLPHRHGNEEEIYFVLQGKGDMVAGETSDGKEMRHPAIKGDAFFVPRNTLVGFYSTTKPGEEDARILAVRFKDPAPK